MNPDALRILLVGNYPPDRQESMQRFADVFLRGLPPVGVKVELIRPEIVWNRRAGSPGIAKWLGYADKYLAFPKRLRRHIAASRPDVVHVCDHSNSMYLRSAPAGRRLITCHDLLAVRSALGEIPQNPTRFTQAGDGARGTAHIRASTIIYLSRSSSLANPTMEGVVFMPSAFSRTLGLPPSITATHEFVVPRSMPITLAIVYFPWLRQTASGPGIPASH